MRATAVRWESDHFPGVIEVVVVDAHRREHRIIEKLPVLTMLDIGADSAFPIELWIDAELDGAQGLTVSSADVI